MDKRERITCGYVYSSVSQVTIWIYLLIEAEVVVGATNIVQTVLVLEFDE